MNRHRAIEKIMGIISEEIVVSNIGDPSKELFHVNDRPRNFYMLGSMGLASSISLGIALSKSDRVICLEGDGALLMNLGSLATIANHNPENLVLITLDNGSYGTTGNQQTFTAGVTNLEKVARACGFRSCYTAKDEEELVKAMELSLTENRVSFIHVTIRSDDEKKSPVGLDPVRIKERFMHALSDEI